MMSQKQKAIRMHLIQHCGNPALFDLLDSDLNMLDKEFDELRNELELYKKALDLAINVGNFDDYIGYEIFEEENKYKPYDKIVKDKLLKESEKQ